MFNFLLDTDNYEERKVARFESVNLLIDTAEVHDGKLPFETAVSDPEYNDGSFIAVEAYQTKEEAVLGHERWVKTMTENPPDKLEDCLNAGTAELLAQYQDMVFPRIITAEK